MSVEHMRSRGTLARNLAWALAVECGVNAKEIASEQGVHQNSVKSSVKRIRSHLARFLSKYPETVKGAEVPASEVRRCAYLAFARHVNVRVALSKSQLSKVPQLELF